MRSDPIGLRATTQAQPHAAGQAPELAARRRRVLQCDFELVEAHGAVVVRVNVGELPVGDGGGLVLLYDAVLVEVGFVEPSEQIGFGRTLCR